MEKLELPFNVIQMKKKDKKRLSKKLSHGDLNLLLEVRDEKGILIGFQPVLSLERRYSILKEFLKHFEHLNNKLHDSSSSEKKKILKDIKQLAKKIEYIYKYKIYFIAGKDDIGEEIERLGSYKKEEMLLSFEPKNSKKY